jgi:hypothetical protein
MSNTFQRVANKELLPINRKASKINDGYSYESSKKVETRDYEILQPTFRSFLDGYKFGWLTVIGRTKAKRKKVSLYLCKCNCGMYTERKAKAIRNPNNNKDACARCLQTRYLQRKQEYLATGRNMD